MNSTKRSVIRRGCALHVDDCPIPARVWRGKAYANILDDCVNCERVVLWAAGYKEYAASDPRLTEAERQEILEAPDPEGFIMCADDFCPWPRR